MKIGTMDQSKLAKNGQEFIDDLIASNTDSIARTADDVKQLHEAKHGAFAKLSDDDFNAFLTSLKFNESGVITGSYKPLMSSLTLTDIYEVFENFGMSREYFSNETIEARCIDGSCFFEFGFFCTSNCGDKRTIEPIK